MTSPARAAANRANARASTGPKTVAGKARVAQNARRHGLRAQHHPDVEAARAAVVLAHAIAGPDAGAPAQAVALRIALAQADVARVRARRDLLLAQAEPDIAALTVLGRYARRALASRRAAIRSFEGLAIEEDDGF